jgi:hypothetical protein
MKSQYQVVMETFHKGKLRSSNGKTVTKESQAKAIASREEQTAKDKGRSKRTWHGRTRMRPNKSK